MIATRLYDVREHAQDRKWAKLYGNNLYRLGNSSVVGKSARIRKINGLFEKGYMPNWSEDHLHIKSRIPKRKTVFKLADDQGHDIKWQFYEEELQAIEENRYLSERIIRKRKTQHGTHDYFVKWKG